MKLNEIQSPGWPPNKDKDVTLETKLKRLGRSVLSDFHAKYAPEYSFSWERRTHPIKAKHYYVHIDFPQQGLTAQSNTKTRTFPLELEITETRKPMNIASLLDTNDDEKNNELKNKIEKRLVAQSLSIKPDELLGKLVDELIGTYKSQFPALQSIDIRRITDNEKTGGKMIGYDRLSFSDAKIRIVKELSKKTRSMCIFRLVFDDEDEQTFKPGPYLIKIDNVVKRVIEKQGHVSGYPYNAAGRLYFSSVKDGDELIIFPQMHSGQRLVGNRMEKIGLLFDRSDEIAAETKKIMEAAESRIEKIEMPCVFDMKFGPRPDSSFLKHHAAGFGREASEFLKQPVITIKIRQK